MAEDPQHTQQATVLVIDDNPANLNLLVDVLTSRNYAVLEASNGADALKIARTQSPDIVLLDVSMPEMDGFEVCKQLKADPLTRDIPVIFISALSETDTIVKGFESGGADYITKPFKFREVLARITNQLTVVQQRREIHALHNQDRQRFEMLARMKDEFIRAATHDLRNPLNVILGYVRLMEHIEVAEPHRQRMKETREAIAENVQKMRQLVTDMLDLAQMEAGMQLHPTLERFAPFLAQVLQSFRVIAEHNKLELTYVPPDEDITIMLDVYAMTRAVDNVVANAIKYTPAGGRIKVLARVENGNAVIQVSDTGMGIPKEDLPHVFNAFYRVNHAQQPDVEGSGLGLSIAKTIIERHGGTIEAKSEVGAGSVFIITLPPVPPRRSGKARLVRNA